MQEPLHCFALLGRGGGFFFLRHTFSLIFIGGSQISLLSVEEVFLPIESTAAIQFFFAAYVLNSFPPTTITDLFLFFCFRRDKKKKDSHTCVSGLASAAS